MRDDDRLDALERALLRLREEADTGTVVVEGAHDLAALETLGIGGTHISIHRGDPLAIVEERLATCAPPVILLLDWDRTGGTLSRRLWELLRARIPVDLENRRRLASCCHARSLEDIPAELASLRAG